MKWELISINKIIIINIIACRFNCIDQFMATFLKKLTIKTLGNVLPKNERNS